jgi:hypothetical protein
MDGRRQTSPQTDGSSQTSRDTDRWPQTSPQTHGQRTTSPQTDRKPQASVPHEMHWTGVTPRSSRVTARGEST